jgi:hypothetical protein
MKYFIISKIVVEGFHCWPFAPPSCHWLRHEHRHLFAIEAKKKVTHTDRDTEFILLGRDIKKYLTIKYGEPCVFGLMSCEDIACEIAKRFKLDSCIVWEDGENAGGVELCE